jgi:NADH-quinone oxidoreductase subunit K
MESALYGSITAFHYVMLSALIFVLGICGIFLNRKNIITLLMSIELILLSANINFVAFSVSLGDLTGQIFTILVLTVAAAEAAIGLAILVIFFRNSATIDVDDIRELRG